MVIQVNNSMFDRFPPQTKLVMCAYIVLLSSIFIPFDMHENVENKGEYGLERRLLVFALMLFPVIVSIYTINCLVVGKCELWAWYNAMLIAIWCSGVFVAAITNVKSVSNNKKN